MTPHSPSAHPDIEQLADLAEDLLTPAAAAELRAHLASCPECADTYAALSEVSLLLGTTEAPPIPADVADRLDAALAAESAAASVPATPHLPHAAPPNRRADSSGPGRPSRLRRRRLGRIVLATAVVAAGLVTTTMLILQPGAVRTSASSAGAAAAAPSRALAPAGPEYSEDQLPSQVHQLLAGQTDRTHPQAMMTEQATGTPDCLAAATGRGDDRPLATGSGRYQGSPVTLLVYRAADGTATLDVYLVTQTCPGATVVLHRTIPA